MYIGNISFYYLPHQLCSGMGCSTTMGIFGHGVDVMVGMLVGDSLLAFVEEFGIPQNSIASSPHPCVAKSLPSGRKEILPGFDTFPPTLPNFMN